MKGCKRGEGGGENTTKKSRQVDTLMQSCWLRYIVIYMYVNGCTSKCRENGVLVRGATADDYYQY